MKMFQIQMTQKKPAIMPQIWRCLKSPSQETFLAVRSWVVRWLSMYSSSFALMRLCSSGAR